MKPHQKKLARFALLAWPALAAFGVWVGCNVYTEDLKVASTAATSTGSGGSSGSSGSGGSATNDRWWERTLKDGCVSSRKPTTADRPKDTSNDEIEPILLGLDKLRLGGRDDQGKVDATVWQGFGFDQDGVCSNAATCENTDPSSPKLSCHPPVFQKDGDQCRDNVLGVLIPSVENLGAEQYRISENGFNCSLCRGVYNMLFRVTRYNGEADDEDVRVDLYASPGLVDGSTFAGTPCSATDETFEDKLCWLNNETFAFKVDEGYLDGQITDGKLPHSLYFDDNAFVRSGYLFAQIPDGMEFWLPHTLDSPVYAFPFRFHKAVVLGKLEKTSSAEWQITDGNVAGMLYSEELYEAFGKLGLCPGDPLYGQLTFAQQNVDLARDGTIDEDIDCDAMSFGIKFTAREAVATEASVVTPLQGCPAP